MPIGEALDGLGGKSVPTPSLVYRPVVDPARLGSMIPLVVDLSIVIPAFNEAEAIGPFVDDLVGCLAGSKISHEIILVNDGSTDGTGETIHDLAERHDTVRALSHGTNRGYGASLKSGIKEAGAEIIAITDADGTYPADRVAGLYQNLQDGKFDMVVGARTGDEVHIPLIRRPAKALIGCLANYVSGTKIPDLNSGLRVFHRDAAIECFHLISDGFSFTTTITLSFIARHRSVEYIPVDYGHRTGRSKIHPIRDTLNFFVLILRTAVFFQPLKIFAPTSLLLAAGGLAWGVVQIQRDGGIGDAPVLLLVSALQVFLVGLIADMISRRG